MSAELPQLLGPRQYNRYVNYRLNIRERLSVAAQNARAEVARLTDRYNAIRDEILNRGILPRNYARTQNTVVEVARPQGGTPNLALTRAVLESAEGVRIGQVYRVDRSLPGVRRSGPTSSWRIPPRTVSTYYRITSTEMIPKPYPTQAAVNAELERRLATNSNTAEYRAALARSRYAAAQASGFRVLG